jgi:glycosyltransferase 2 family protein
LSKKVTDLIKYLVFLLLGVFLLWLSFRKLDLHEVWADILQANYLWVLGSVIFAVIAHAFRALRWNLLIGSLGYKTRLSTTFYAVMVGYMANTAVPRMGELMRCGMLARKDKVPFNVLFGSVISERLLDMVVLLVLLFCVIVFQWELAGGLVTSLTEPFLTSMQNNFTLIVIIAILLVLSLAAMIILALVFKARIKEMPGYSKTREIIEGLLNGIKTIKLVKKRWLFAFYTLCIWFFYVLMIYLPFFMLPETSQLDLMAAVTFLAIGSLGIVAPVPGGIGAYHFIGKAVLVEVYAISGATAGSFVAITHAAQTLLHVVVGGLSYFLLSLMNGKNKTDEYTKPD